ncbi:hypothetical protein JAAARDRAFT_42636 [Jaapia argillacea MUCL 33604]|uniref:Peptidase M43 pregnancy-associated plasma-A domain-containing protein n=1 Tax=Jaapia argillacea MUCL 33604 TaxID=933084 RepID=A0A067P4J6_9AGAM|nr:hypothetical protein JAAARDRAFT_42636 [Jaapia argillacea MUCL 33604]
MDIYVQNQVTILNRAFVSVGISFKSAKVTRWLAPAWFTISSLPDAAPMKERLAVISPDVLNIYVVGVLPKPTTRPGTTLGYSSFPWNYTTDPISDGVMVVFSTLPGGGFLNQDLGANVVHEVGHWSGLWHTFQGGCPSPNNDGDSVADTPAEALPTFGCPTVAADSCPGDPGLDPIHNFMDYTDDTCRTQFTPGQVSRMRNMLRSYRGIDV